MAGLTSDLVDAWEDSRCVHPPKHRSKAAYLMYVASLWIMHTYGMPFVTKLENVYRDHAHKLTRSTCKPMWSPRKLILLTRSPCKHTLVIPPPPMKPPNEATSILPRAGVLQAYTGLINPKQTW